MIGVLAPVAVLCCLIIATLLFAWLFHHPVESSHDRESHFSVSSLPLLLLLVLVSVQALMQAVAQQPVSIAIEADQVRGRKFHRHL